MKLTKQNKLYLGIAALGVVGYLIWKQTQKKKQEFLGDEAGFKLLPSDPTTDTNFKRYRLLSDFYTPTPKPKTFKKGQIVSGIEVTNMKTNEITLQVREISRPGGYFFYYIPINLVQQLRDRRDIMQGGGQTQREGNKKMFVPDNMNITSSNWM
jgi:hypothetical protein